jgi:hypothetical protein
MEYYNYKKKIIIIIGFYSDYLLKQVMLWVLYHVGCVLDILDVQAVSISQVAVYEMRSVVYRIMWSSHTNGRAGNTCLI